MRLAATPFAPFLAVLFLTAGLIGGCAAAATEVQPFVYDAVPWADGETSVFRITDRGGDYAGTVRYDVNINGSDAVQDGWTLRRETITPDVTEIVAVQMTDRGLQPTAAMLVRTQPAGVERVETTYDTGQVDMKLTTVGDVTTYQRSSIPSDARDQRTVLYLARLLPLDEGYATRFNSYLPVADQLLRVTLRVVGREEVETPVGVFDAWRIRLESSDGEFDAWIGVDAPYPLLRYRDGRSGGTFALSEYAPGAVDQ